MGSGLSNYNIAHATTEVLTVTARPVTVTADAKTKIYGASDPTLTHQVTRIAGWKRQLQRRPYARRG